ncbi:hypothetical protein ASG43_05720 [Aureimonas sp. Leaf454]|uniref:RDD family protein n=1 Tax=Aureimonas sp. Leaf454 TaxID=1736381 RepID=UPI0006F5E376|nr:RDD family protein [Aureimonas sp. Leaf454]KQT51029.1 hypothetical protein ASG43_05720 [Aureimonas sp. Leaf454]
MTFSSSASFDRRPHDDARLFDGVRTRRMAAFVIDYAIVALLMIPASILIFFLGIVTLGLGWGLYAILFPLIAVPYVGFTMGGRSQGTPGMRAMGLRIDRLDGGLVDPVLAVLHGVIFWASNALLTPAVLLVALFTPRKQLLQDLLLGTVVTRR